MTLSYSREARERIRSLSPEIKKEIKQALESLREDPYVGKPLKRELAGYWSLRVKQYRILYQWIPDGKTLQIHTIGRREKVYEELVRRLLENH